MRTNLKTLFLYQKYSNTSNQTIVTLINMSTTTRLQKKSLNSPDEVRTFEKGKIEIGNIGDVM
jgi:hypothetical protein